MRARSEPPVVSQTQTQSGLLGWLPANQVLLLADQRSTHLHQPSPMSTDGVVTKYYATCANVANVVQADTSGTNWWYTKKGQHVEVWGTVSLKLDQPNVPTSFKISLPPTLPLAPYNQEVMGLWNTINPSVGSAYHWRVSGVVVANAGWSQNVWAVCNDGPQWPSTDSGQAHVHFRYRTSVA
jgi:hypothetical protein